MSPIRVLIVDDHPIFRDGLRSSLERDQDIVVVGELGDGELIVETVAALEPDVVILDLNMPRVGGIAATRMIDDAHPGVSVVVLTMRDDEASVLAALHAGARGYVLKDADRDDILRAIHAAANGDAILGPAASRVMSRHLGVTPSTPSRPFADLTEREYEVLTLLATGLTNAQIADRLRLRNKTVRNYLSNVFAKLQVSDRGHAIVLAREAGVTSAASRRD